MHVRVTTALASLCWIGCGGPRPLEGGPADGGAALDGSALAADAGVLFHDAGAAHEDGGAPAASGPRLEIVSGSGTVVASGWPAGDALRVRALDATLAPVAGATVTFAQSKGNAIHVQTPTVTTDADGIASASFNAFPIQPNLGFEEDSVRASWAGLSVDLDVIVTQVPSGQLAMPPLVQFTAPGGAPADLGSMKAGAIAKGGLAAIAVLQQGPAYGQGVPHWGLRLTQAGDLARPAAVGCAGGTAIADAQGRVACDLVAPSTPGDYAFTVFAGGSVRWDGHLHVTP